MAQNLCGGYREKVGLAVNRIWTNRISQRYIVFEDRNLDFTYNELRKFYMLYDAGLDIPKIASRMNRRTMEILLLYLDQVEKECIEPNFILTRC